MRVLRRYSLHQVSYRPGAIGWGSSSAVSLPMFEFELLLAYTSYALSMSHLVLCPFDHGKCHPYCQVVNTPVAQLVGYVFFACKQVSGKTTGPI